MAKNHPSVPVTTNQTVNSSEFYRMDSPFVVDMSLVFSLVFRCLPRCSPGFLNERRPRLDGGIPALRHRLRADRHQALGASAGMLNGSPMVIKPSKLGVYHRKTIGKWRFQWENHRKIIGKWRFQWENHGKTIGKWRFQWENHRKTIGKWRF